MLTRINFAQQRTIGIEFVEICIPDSANPIQTNPNPQHVSTHAVPEANQNAKPSRAPYIIHWNVDNIPVRCGWSIDFNTVLNELT